MTTDFRALCAELVNRFDELYGRICDDDTIIYVDSEVNELMNYARAALAEAVPEGREPASVIEQPTVMQLIELSDEIEAAGLGQVDFARAVLARWGNRQGSLDSSPPANSEVAELVEWLYEQLHVCLQAPWTPGIKHFGRAAQLLQRQYPRPVPVSERLPRPSDCAPWPQPSDASAWCWVGTSEDGGWCWEQRSAGCLEMFPDDFTHWLPAHALPLPDTND